MSSSRPKQISERFIRSVTERLAENKVVRRRLPVWGRLHIDRQLPFLCVYRRPSTHADPGADRLVLGEASYLQAVDDRALARPLSALVRAIAETQGSVFGAFLVIEIWSSPPAEDEPADTAGVSYPAYRIVPPSQEDLASTVKALEASLRASKIRGQLPTVEISPSRRIAPPGLGPLLTRRETNACGAALMGLEVRPVYWDRAEDAVFPDVLRAVHHQLSRALKRAVFEFTRKNTSHLPPHYQSLGRRALVGAVWQVDRQLAEVSGAYDFLLGVTPVNIQGAWREFRRSRFEKVPRFVYRPAPVSPPLLKRRLFAIPLERIEDPVLAEIFREKQIEVDLELNGLQELETKRFLYTSLQLFGAVDDQLLKEAIGVLDRVPPHSREDSPAQVGAERLGQRAEEEFVKFRAAYPEFAATVAIRDDVTGVMVSSGNLLVDSSIKLPASRLEALIQHEVGTHVLTYYNGRSQPFHQMYAGLAGYEELQEGLAVLAEYLVGGLSLPRLRLLAARVVAARRLTEGASFVETFRELDRGYEFSQQTAFRITARVFRGGGLTKDALYLRGLLRLHKHLRDGGELEPLFLGKISVDNVPVIQELMWRKVLHTPPLRPPYLDDPEALKRLERLRSSSSVLELLAARMRPQDSGSERASTQTQH